MTRTTRRTSTLALATAGLVAALALVGPGAARADSAPVGPLPAGPVSTTTTKPGQLVAVASARERELGLVWRIARSFNAKVVRAGRRGRRRQQRRLVFKVVGKGNTSLVLRSPAATPSWPKAVKSATQRVHAA